MSVKLLVIVIIDFKRYPSSYCLMQGKCFVCRKYMIECVKILKVQNTKHKHRRYVIFETVSHIKAHRTITVLIIKLRQISLVGRGEFSCPVLHVCFA